MRALLSRSVGIFKFKRSVMKFAGLLLTILFSSILIAPAFAAGPITGIEGPFVSVAEGKLVVTLKMPEAIQPNGFAFDINAEKKSRVNFVAAEEGGMVLEMKLDLDDLEAYDVAEGENNTLPDGRMIPGVPGGALKNSKRVDRTNDFVTFHSPKSFGIAVPFNWNLGSTRDGHHWLSWKGKNIGMISVVNASGEKKAYGMIFLRYGALRGNTELMARLSGPHKNF